MPADFHNHTNISYCADRAMTMRLYLDALRKSADIFALGITDHAMAIYFPSDIAWSWSYIEDSSVFDRHRDFGNERLQKHLAELESHGPEGIIPGIEAEMMADGRLDFDPAFRKRLKILIGAVHYLPFCKENGFGDGEILRRWERHVIDLVNTGIDILAHPFRWISAQVEYIPEKLLERVVDECLALGVALELNSHYEIAFDLPMLRRAAEKGALISLGSDSHRPDEICDLSYQARVVRSAGLAMSDLNILKPEYFQD